MRGELRRFGLIVGGVFLALGSWWLYRDSSPVLFGPAILIGGALMLAGVLIPGRLAPIHRGWMGLAERLSSVVTRIILTIIYYLVVTPIGLGLRLAGKDLLRRRAPGSESYWLDYPDRDADHYRKLY